MTDTDNAKSDWIFGYGSLINNSSRKSTITDDDETLVNACLVELSPQFGYQRRFCFRYLTLLLTPNCINLFRSMQYRHNLIFAHHLL